MAKMATSTLVARKGSDLDFTFLRPTLWKGKAEGFLSAIQEETQFDLIVTSPPYNIGKEYETSNALPEYVARQAKVIEQLVARLSSTGSLCWQVGTYVKNGSVLPLDILFHPVFEKLGLTLRNRIVWRFGHGQHAKRRFSGRYEVVLWYTKSDKYHFNLDAVRVPSKYPGKKSYRGAKKGDYSSNPMGKNPEDVWDIPNVKGNHVEKTVHPCQFPVALVERLVLALTKKDELVFDPYAGVASTGVAALLHNRRFVGCERMQKYIAIGKSRLERAVAGSEQFRPHDKPIYDHTKSPLSKRPETFSADQPVSHKAKAA